MPASVYKLVFNDPELKKLAHSDLEIDTYTTDTVKIVGSCQFNLVHLDTKKLQEVTFNVAKNDGSVLLSCTTTIALGLYKLTQDWIIYLQELASLQALWTTQRRPESLSTQTKVRSVCSKYKSSSYSA